LVGTSVGRSVGVEAVCLVGGLVSVSVGSSLGLSVGSKADGLCVGVTVSFSMGSSLGLSVGSKADGPCVGVAVSVSVGSSLGLSIGSKADGLCVGVAVSFSVGSSLGLSVGSKADGLCVGVAVSFSVGSSLGLSVGSKADGLCVGVAVSFSVGSSQALLPEASSLRMVLTLFELSFSSLAECFNATSFFSESISVDSSPVSESQFLRNDIDETPPKERKQISATSVFRTGAERSVVFKSHREFSATLLGLTMRISSPSPAKILTVMASSPVLAMRIAKLVKSTGSTNSK